MQKPQHAVGTRRIEARDRLVGENERWLLHERSRNTDALLLAAGQLIGAAQRTVDQADAFDGIQTEPLLVCRERQQGAKARVITETSRQDVGEHARTTDQLMLLEHHTGASPVGSDITAAGECPDSVDENTAARWPHKTIKCAQQR